MTIDKPPKVAKISNGKLCPRCHYKKPPIAFLSRKSRNAISLLCDTCRMKNSTRYIAKEHNQKERIFKTLKLENIYKINVYIVYLEQSKRCFVSILFKYTTGICKQNRHNYGLLL